MPLPGEVQALIYGPRYVLREVKDQETALHSLLTGVPRPPPRHTHLKALFEWISARAAAYDIAWGEWASLVTASLFALNSPGSLKCLHTFVVTDEVQKPLPLTERVERSCLLREIGLACVGLIGTPKVGAQCVTKY